MEGQCALVFVHLPGETQREFLEGFALFCSAAQDLVVDIGDVAHVFQRPAARAQVARDHVEADQQTRVPEVAVVIHRDAADVEADAAGLQGYEILYPTRERVVDAQSHLSSPWRSRTRCRAVRWYG